MRLCGYFKVLDPILSPVKMLHFFGKLLPKIASLIFEEVFQRIPNADADPLAKGCFMKYALAGKASYAAAERGTFSRYYGFPGDFL